MKKLISAATSLAMAATMLSAAVPFATGAAAAKSFELKAYLNPDGTQASTTINVDNGDVTVPVALYAITEADVQSVNALFTVNSADGDASKVVFEGTEPILPGAEYFTTEQTITTASGAEISTTALVGWNDKVSESKRGSTIAPDGTYTFFIEQAGSQYNPCDNACVSGLWIGQGYSFVGSSSSDYPVLVVNVTFPKGIAAGDYTLDFVNEAKDDKGNYTTMMEGSTKYSKANGNIDFVESGALTITVEGEKVDPPTTTAPVTTAAPATTAPTTTADAPKTTSPDAAGKVTDDSIIVSGGEYTVDFTKQEADDFDDAGNAYIFADAMLEDTTGRTVSMIKAFLADLPEGISLDPDAPYEHDFQAVGSKTDEYLNGGIYINCLKAGEPVYIDNSKPIIMYTFVVDKDTPTGDYEFTWDQFEIVESSSKDPYEAKKVAGVIHVVNGDTPVTTTEAPKTTAPTTTEAPKTTVPTTTAAPTQAPTKAGDPVWGDTNCDGTVNIADVVVLNRWLTDSSAITISDQGKLNADCCDPKDGAGLDSDDSDAIIRRIVHLVTLPTTK